MSNYRAVIVDDEPRVRRGLTALIPRLDSEWEVVGEAKNGVEAIELVKREKPDLVISDIRMPQMNGLDLLSALKEYPVHVVILSGYGYFEYAQTAVKFGAFDYLLKPVKPAEIENLLKRVKELKRLPMPSAETHHNPLNFANWWKEWLSESEESADYADKLKQQLPQSASRYQMMTIEIDRYDELITDDQWGDKQLVTFAVRNIVNEIMADSEHGQLNGTYLFSRGSQFTYLFVNGICQYEQAERLIGQVKKWVKISISIGLSEETADFNVLPDLYRHAGEALQNKWIYGDGLVCRYEDVSKESNETIDYPSEIDEAIVRSIRGGDAEKALEGLSAFMDKVMKVNIPFRLFRRLGLQLLSSVFRVVYENKIQERVVERSSHQPQELFHRNFTVEEYVRYMSELIHSIVISLEWNRQQKHNRTIEKAMEFIRVNYPKDLSLEDVAAHVNVSGSYFSTYFKQETGESFIEYLTRLRMEKAKMLMMNAELRLYEICQLVGYQDVKYFSRLFKRNVGVSPAEYRQFFYRKED